MISDQNGRRPKCRRRSHLQRMAKVTKPAVGRGQGAMPRRLGSMLPHGIASRT